ncbi:hypothetical protein ACE1OC_31875 [Streptomyces sp. DSM 116496]
MEERWRRLREDEVRTSDGRLSEAAGVAEAISLVVAALPADASDAAP